VFSTFRFISLNSIALFILCASSFAADYEGGIPLNTDTLGGPNSFALDINDSGQVVGYSYLFYSVNFRHAFLWDETNGISDLGAMERQNSFAHAINNNGVVTGYTMDPPFNGEPFIWDAVNGMRALPTLGGQIAFGLDINDSGTVVGHGFNSSGIMRGFVWNETDGIIEIPTLGGTESYLYNINNDGEAVGSAQDAAGVYHPIIWDAVNGVRQWDIEGEATSINNSGQVAGVFIVPSGEAHGFVYSTLFFSTQFENGMPVEVTSSDWQIETMDSGADGTYGDHGFSSTQFLRSPTNGDTPNSVVFEFSGLESHSFIELDLLLASIDKTNNQNMLTILVDDQIIFSEDIQSGNNGWQPDAPVELFSNLRLGYVDDKKKGNDKGLDLGELTGVEHQLGVNFSTIPHTGTTLKLEIISNHAKKKYDGNTFAIDNLRISLDQPNILSEIDDLGGTFSLARKINDNGVVVGLASDASEIAHAFVWDPVNGLRNLNQLIAPGTDWFLTQAWSINNQNVITGEGSNIELRGFVLNP
jgi:probable HAF family extracellular repeat protein